MLQEYIALKDDDVEGREMHARTAFIGHGWKAWERYYVGE